ncbi:MAG: xanthine dehydrogenase family protein subunit M [Chloroflexi bacterium]|nr:MAG: xanthine dehydrogenase family protein subunit M [Chloroflexota bacterium]
MSHRWAAPTALADALGVLATDPGARPVAGGTDLVVGSRQGRRPLPDSIVAIDRIPELAGQRADPDGSLVLGALTSHAWLASADAVVSSWTALADAAAIVGSPATRGTGTLGGNIMNASPAAETVGPLIVAGAVATLVSSTAKRQLAVAEVATGPGRTAATAGELLLTEVRVPAPPEGSGSAYVRLEYRAAMEIAVVGATAFVALDGSAGGDGSAARATIREARIALTAVAPTIIRATAAEERLAGRSPDAAAFAAAGQAAAAAASPISDVRASAEYRRAMIEVVVARALSAAARRAAGEDVPVPASRWAHGQEV